jgi:hypothetical protein
VAWTVVSNTDRTSAPAAAHATAAASQAAYRHALSVGFDRAFLVAAAITVLMLVTAITMIRVRRADLAGHS